MLLSERLAHGASLEKLLLAWGRLNSENISLQFHLLIMRTN